VQTNKKNLFFSKTTHHDIIKTLGALSVGICDLFVEKTVY
jgi:hypothetical protein